MPICGQSWLSVTICASTFTESGSGSTLETRWTSPIRLTNKTTASTNPTSTATVRSAKTVNRKVMNSTSESPVFSLSR
ncbi:hypothetical protein D3C87_1845150 [compost metagenome]